MTGPLSMFCSCQQTQAVFSHARSTQVLSAQRRTAALVVRAEAAGAGEKTVVIGLAADSGAYTMGY